MTEKKVVHAWTQSARNYRQEEKPVFWGIGDLLRGSNVLFNECKRLGAEYVLDINGHPVSQIFLPAQAGLEAHYDVDFWTFKSLEDVHHRLKEALTSVDVLTINTNGGPVWPSDASVDWKAFILRHLRPNDYFQEILSSSLPSEPYSVFQFRLGDGGLVRGEEAELKSAIEVLDRHYDKSDIIITDSANFQAFVQKHRPQIQVSSSQPVHTGISTDVDNIARTMKDFFLIAGALRAKSFSVYPGPSGFVVSASRIFNVPLTHFGATTNEGRGRKILNRLFRRKGADSRG
ncbi:hypothetical protein ASF91_06500 [Rhizobium sp. Leaf155]|nr:hypothetical protein ASF91_06500 [Rhizobium sp. Leaf155]